MKKSGTVAVSVVAASASASASAVSVSFSSRLPSEDMKQKHEKIASDSADEKKFAPRFDGLRFIETLVTAHR